MLLIQTVRPGCSTYCIGMLGLVIETGLCEKKEKAVGEDHVAGCPKLWQWPPAVSDDILRRRVSNDGCRLGKLHQEVPLVLLYHPCGKVQENAPRPQFPANLRLKTRFLEKLTLRRVAVRLAGLHGSAGGSPVVCGTARAPINVPNEQYGSVAVKDDNTRGLPDRARRTDSRLALPTAGPAL